MTKAIVVASGAKQSPFSSECLPTSVWGFEIICDAGSVVLRYVEGCHAS